MAGKFDVYQAVTDKIIVAMETSNGNWECPWNRAGTSLPVSVAGRSYRGMNTVLLWCAAEEHGYQSRRSIQ